MVFGAVAFKIYILEASDLLLGDHLCEQSVTVKWINISLPHKKTHRLKHHKVLKDMAKANPETENIFEDNIIDLIILRDQEILSQFCS